MINHCQLLSGIISTPDICHINIHQYIYQHNIKTYQNYSQHTINTYKIETIDSIVAVGSNISSDFWVPQQGPSTWQCLSDPPRPQCQTPLSCYSKTHACLFSMHMYIYVYIYTHMYDMYNFMYN